MKELETRLFAILDNDPGPTGLDSLAVGGIHRRRIPEGVTLPAIVFSKEANAERRHTLRNEVMRRFVYLIRAVDEGLDEAKAADMLARVDALLENIDLAVPGWQTGFCRRIGDFELTENDTSGHVWQHLGGRYRIDLLPA